MPADHPQHPGAAGSDDLRPGDRFGDFIIEAVAGRGAMGVVYRAREESLGRIVALKVIARPMARDPAFRARFTREARAAAGLNHPHIVSVHGAGETDGEAWIAMQWIDGEDLHEHLAEHGAPAPATAVRIVTQIADALDAAHGAGVMHRDVKPANILVRQMGAGLHAYLTDFGVTRALQDAETVSVELTAPGHMIGTPGFLAPEQIQGHEADGRADLYALGCVLFETLTGGPALRRDTPMATLLAHASDPRPLVSASAPALGTRYDAVVARAMAIDPDERHADGRELAQALSAAAAPATSTHTDSGRSTGITAPLAPGVEATSPPPPTPTRRVAHQAAARPVEPAIAPVADQAATPALPRGVLLASGAVLLVLLLAGGLWLAFGDSGGDRRTAAQTAPPSSTAARATTTAPATRGTPAGTPGTTTSAAAAASAGEVVDVLQGYADAFSASNVDAMAPLLTSDVRRIGGNGLSPGCVTTTDRFAALTIYRRQFAQVRDYRFPELRAADVTVDGDVARISTRSQITSAAGPLRRQPIAFVLRRRNGRWQISAISAKCR